MESIMLKIYGVPISVHTRKVIITAMLKRLPFELVPVVPVMPDQLPANWHTISPSGLIPALQDGDFQVADSAAICAYLERVQPAIPLYPTDDRAYAKVLALQAYAGDVVFQSIVRPLFHEVFVHPKVRHIETNQSAVQQVLDEVLPKVFGYLNTTIEEEYFVGNGLTVADLAVASNLVTFQYIGFELDRQKYRRLAALFDRVISHPAVREALHKEAAVVDSMGLTRKFLAA
jgi:glutathione S-transferase